MVNKKYIFKSIAQLLMHVLLHVLFWLGVLLFYTYFFGVGSKNFSNTLSFSVFLMPITIATTYVSIYKLIPDYLITKRYALFALYSLYTLIVSAYLILVSIFFSLIHLSDFKYDTMNPVTRNLIFVMTGVYLVTIVVSAFKLLKLNLKHTNKASQLETKILDTQLKLKAQELNYLKMQIHPHFLFNTLNTMYGLSLKKAEQTPEMILKLSNLLDYLLYQVDKPFVSLTEEINHIKDYISLEKMRFNDTLDITFKTENISETTMIAPMLFIPFVENSFKHGTQKSGRLAISISITCDENNIHFNIKNTAINESSSSKGIGLENIKKRLELLYKNSYNLTLDKKEDVFAAALTLPTTYV